MIECTRCVLTTKDDPEIYFDNGICNHCLGYAKKLKEYPDTPEKRVTALDKILAGIKKNKKGKYDSILGISGGVDSTYLAYKVKHFGLNPLLVHFDNGWNSELAVQNVENLINKTGFDLFTYVVDWEEFKDLQLSYIKASVLDWEIPTDHGFYAMLFDQAYKHKIKYIISGHNLTTEGILPKCMRWSKLDVANIVDIHNTYGSKKLKTFPLLAFAKKVFYQKVRKFQVMPMLNYMEYDKDEAKRVIIDELGWKDYGGKHYESIFTRFYQGYVLLEKFGFDKRVAHLATLINSGQMSKDDAKLELSRSGYNKEQLEEDKEYVVKKMGLTMDEFNSIMKEPPRSHLEFKSYETGVYLQHEKFMQQIKPIINLVKKTLGK